MARRRWAPRMRTFALDLDTVNAAIAGPGAWQTYFGDDANEAWDALRAGVGHGDLASWLDLPDPMDEPDPRDAQRRPGREIETDEEDD